MAAEARDVLTALYEAAVHAAHPDGCLTAQLPEVPKSGRLIIVGAGKAGAAMAATAERNYRARGQLDRVDGVLTAPYGYAATLGDKAPKHLQIIEGRHPTPDNGSIIAAQAALALARAATKSDLVLVLLSGGASALWAAPVSGLTREDKTALTRGLLKSGADIHEMNTVRRHLSEIKGGRLAMAAGEARLLTLAISDVPGDDPATIGSGPTVPDPTTLADARAVITKRRPRMEALGLPVPDAVTRALDDPANETAKPGDPAFARADYRLIATPAVALEAAATLARQQGYEVVNLGDTLTGEARDVATAHARLALEARAQGRKVAIISGGELEVTVRNRSGQGGRSQEYALALAVALNGTPGISGLAADTDGIDGGDGAVTSPAGAIVLPDLLARAARRHLDAKMFLDSNDATPFFAVLGDLLVRGPTHTNVNDFRAILIDT
ncbi:MAG: glycerate kinase [Hyphomicrobiaceae bacterium]